MRTLPLNLSGAQCAPYRSTICRVRNAHLTAKLPVICRVRNAHLTAKRKTRSLLETRS